MFTSVQGKIITALDGLENNGAPLFRLVDVWQGDVEELLKNAQKMPSMHLVFTCAEFGQSQTTSGKQLPPNEATWSLILIAQNLLNRKSGAVESLQILERVLQLYNIEEPAKGGITSLETGNGRLWPVIVQLLGQENGKAAYGLKFYNKKGY